MIYKNQKVIPSQCRHVYIISKGLNPSRLRYTFSPPFSLSSPPPSSSLAADRYLADVSVGVQAVYRRAPPLQLDASRKRLALGAKARSSTFGPRMQTLPHISVIEIDLNRGTRGARIVEREGGGGWGWTKRVGVWGIKPTELGEGEGGYVCVCGGGGGGGGGDERSDSGVCRAAGPRLTQREQSDMADTDIQIDRAKDRDRQRQRDKERDQQPKLRFLFRDRQVRVTTTSSSVTDTTRATALTTEIEHLSRPP